MNMEQERKGGNGSSSAARPLISQVELRDTKARLAAECEAREELESKVRAPARRGEVWQC